jgi:CTP synthase
MSKYIIVTGGVVSGLGKGITAASIGLLLKSSGVTADAVKFDPYLNIDPGTMSPFEHGEVYVLDDSSETDLDLGHYERFLDVNLTQNSSVTAGKIYNQILERERDGVYLGKNVQLIPHVTNYIKECFQREVKTDVRIIEIGGSTGDMEAEIFLESYRQFRREHRTDVLHIHLGYVPYLDCSGEYKSKPLQNSIRELLRAGLQPDIIVARYAEENGEVVSNDILNKIALFSNLPTDAVIPLPDFNSIYEVPRYLASTSILNQLSNFVGKNLEPKLSEFFEKAGSVEKTNQSVRIGIVGKYGSKLGDADYSLQQSIKIAGFASNVNIEIDLLNAEKFEKTEAEESVEWAKLKACDGIIVPGGFGKRGMEGKINAAKYARENKIPYLGICLGLQMAVVEFARNVLNLNAFTSEMFENRDELEGKDILIDFIPEQLQIHKKGGTMRLGGYDCEILPSTLASQLYSKKEIRERHRHRLEVQAKYIAQMEENGFKVSGRHNFKTVENEDSYLVEIMELDQNIHPFYIGIQSHPEFLSRPNNPHPLFKGLIEASKKK